MVTLNCKMCGGELKVVEGQSVAQCEYCSSLQTLPVVDDEKKLNLFARANRLRLHNEFDKAERVYEAIVADFPQEAEAYWGLVLCKYGIEYVDDPATGKKIPTCHRSSLESVMDDDNFEQALENADVAARKVYREQAAEMEELRKAIIAVSAKEAPYDIFICYKETDENGDRTVDSVIAQDVYEALTAKGYRVFFSRITLEDKLGQDYESYIFAALNSAKVMLVFGTDYEYFSAVWVKNEWSRYLKLMAKDKERHLIPCYKNIGPYDMPREFGHLQAQDMGKVGAIQDLLRGIDKLLPRQTAQPVVQAAAQAVAGPNPEAVAKRGFIALADRDWKKAEELFDKALDMDVDNAQAYFGMALVGSKATSVDDLIYQYRRRRIELKSVRVSAVPNSQSARLELVKPYVVPNYLREKDLYERTAFDGNYSTDLEELKSLRARVQLELNAAGNLARAERLGNEKMKSEIQRLRRTVTEYYEDELARCKAKDEAEIQRIQGEYQAFLTKFHREAKALSEKAQQQRAQRDRQRAYDSSVEGYREQHMQSVIAEHEAALKKAPKKGPQRKVLEEKLSVLHAHQEGRNLDAAWLNQQINASRKTTAGLYVKLAWRAVLGCIAGMLVLFVLIMIVKNADGLPAVLILLTWPATMVLVMLSTFKELKKEKRKRLSLIRARDGISHYPDLVEKTYAEAEQMLRDSL